MTEEPQTNGERIRQFHLAMGGTLPDVPALPEIDTLIVRRTLIDEEYAEVTAVFNHIFSARQRGEDIDITPLIHELTDLLYVTYGAFWACGVDPDPIFAEVHRANMQKANGPRRADGKVLKPAGWQPPDVAGAIQRQGQQPEN
ncbi:MAG: hypothetical protein KC443_06240 [Anaerolineales bacterium]|nr:hypothetical protein [Anaerolineales bacterium]